MTDIGGGGVRRDDPDSSREAAASIAVRRNQQMVLDALRALGVASATDVGNYYGRPRDFLGPRFDRMLELGWIKKLGMMKRPNARGRWTLMQVWSLSEREVDLEAEGIKPRRPKPDVFEDLSKRIRSAMPKLTLRQRRDLVNMIARPARPNVAQDDTGDLFYGP